MLHKAARHVLLLLMLVLGGAGSAWAQNNTRSPYSRFGSGDLSFTGFVTGNGMGRIGTAFQRNNSINVLNPASYGSLQYTVFECAATTARAHISDSSQKNAFNNASYGYMAIGFPLWSKIGWGASFGIQPLSSTGYDIVSYVRASNNIPTQTTYTGTGGISRVYFGQGVRVWKQLKAGVNFSYIHGQVRTSKRAMFYDPKGLMNNYLEERTRYVSDIGFDFGLLYSDTLNRHHTNRKHNQVLTFGFNFTPSLNLNSQQKLFARTLQPGSNGDSQYDIRDTVLYTDNLAGTMHIPAAWRAGVTWQKDNYCMLGMDVYGQNWTKFTNYGQPDSLSNSYGIAIGGMIVPDINAIKAKWKHLEYRAGLHYTKTQLLIRGEHINEWGAGIGLGIPTMRNRSKVNLALEYLQRGTTDNHLLRESYVRFTLGITFADSWFHRYKIN